MLEAAEQEPRAQHEERVGDDGAGDGRLGTHSPARKAARPITSSLRLRTVAFKRPPAASPVLAATDSVAWLRSVASGTIASTDSTESSV
jgi:hypothetical protein